MAIVAFENRPDLLDGKFAKIYNDRYKQLPARINPLLHRGSMATFERKFLARYGSMTEREFWWFVEQNLRERFERLAR